MSNLHGRKLLIILGLAAILSTPILIYFFTEPLSLLTCEIFGRDEGLITCYPDPYTAIGILILLPFVTGATLLFCATKRATK